MPGLCSWVVLGALLLCGCVVASYAQNFRSHEDTRIDKICYEDASSSGLTLDQAANEQSAIEDDEGLEIVEVTVNGTFSWNLREGCESGTINFPGTDLPPRGLPIRDQANCAACWAYAHADFVTLWHCQHNNTNDMTQMTQVASLQQHVDCVPSKSEFGVRNAGCGTGSLKLASLYYMGLLTAVDISGSGATTGFASEADYPLTFSDTGPNPYRIIVRDAQHNHGQCMYQPNAPFPWGQAPPPVGAVQLLIDVGPLSQQQMTYLFQEQRAPFATSMFVTYSHMIIRSCCDEQAVNDESNQACYGKPSETSGVSVYSNTAECPQGALANHAVVAVGMATTTSAAATNYWLIRNSWGSGWGDKGHVRLLRDSGNTHVPGSDPTRPGGVAMCSLGYMNSYPRQTGGAPDRSCSRYSFH